VGVYDVVRRGLRRTIIEALDGFTSDDVRSLCIRANTLADLSMRGKYADCKTAIMVAGNVRIISRITALLGYPRRKRSVPRVEVIHWGDEREIPIAPSEVVDETRTGGLLAEIAGPSIRAQLDIKRECVSGLGEGLEVQGKKQILDLVPPDCIERVQPSSQIQAT
jgi:hypothetical protein